MTRGLEYALPGGEEGWSLIIRCERCSTLYELDESLLAPDGSDVQCTRCQHVFLARPPRAPGQTLQGMPVPEPSPAPSEPAPPRAAPPTPEPAHATLASASHQAPRYTPGMSAYRPPISQPGVPRPPLLRRDAVGTFENRLRWSHRWKWLAPTLFLAVVALGVVAFLLRESAFDPRVRHAHQSALGVAYRDDLASLEEARARLGETLRVAPRMHSVRADRALVELLMAGALLDQSSDSGGPARNARGEALAAEASRALEDLERAKLAPAEVARARAVAAALGTDRAQVKRLATAAQRQLADDPLVQVAEQSAEIRSGDRAARERAIGALGLLVARRPEVLRARWVLARGQALAGHRAEALATLDGLLKANPRHEGGRALKDALARAVAAPAGSAPVASPAPAAPPQQGVRAEKPPVAGRKPDIAAGQPATGASTGAAASANLPRKPPAGAAPAAGQEPPPEAGAPDAPAAGGDRPPGDAEPAPLAPRLKPAAVPEPEPVQGGG